VVELYELDDFQGTVQQRRKTRILTRDTSVQFRMDLEASQHWAQAYYATITAQQVEGDIQRTPLQTPRRKHAATLVTASFSGVSSP
jgi:hypothetical protein